MLVMQSTPSMTQSTMYSTNTLTETRQALKKKVFAKNMEYNNEKLPIPSICLNSMKHRNYKS